MVEKYQTQIIAALAITILLICLLPGLIANIAYNLEHDCQILDGTQEYSCEK